MKCFARYVKYFVLILVASLGLPSDARVLLTVFSYNRPLQLATLLDSITKFVTGIDSIAILYRADPSFETAYQALEKYFKHIRFVRQDKATCCTDFKIKLRELFAFYDPQYCIFAVDDNVVLRPINIIDNVIEMEKASAYGYFYRLGSNITSCYMTRKETPVPPLRVISAQSRAFSFKNQTGDWGYPNTVDMTLYRTKDVLFYIENLAYNNPNLLEGAWASRLEAAIAYNCCLCPDLSCVTNVPLNRVQTTYGNRHQNSITVDDLLSLFWQGYLLDINDMIEHIDSFCAPHIDYVPKLIKADWLFNLVTSC